MKYLKKAKDRGLELEKDPRILNTYIINGERLGYLKKPYK
jgi:hypothetical protein